MTKSPMERTFRAIFDSPVDLALIVVAPDGRITDWNKGAERIFGWGAEEIGSQSFTALLPPEEGATERFQAGMQCALQGGCARSEDWYLRKDTTRFWASINVTPLWDDDGAHLGFLTILRDRTEEKKAQEALAESEEHLRITRRAGGIGSFEWNLTDGTVKASDEFCAVWGIDTTSPTTQELAKLVLPNHQRDPNELREEADNGLFSSEYRIRRANDGEIRWITRKWEPFREPSGEIVRGFGVVYDITERKLVEEALRESEQQFRTLAQTLPNHVWIASTQGTLEWFNDRMYEYSGATGEEITGTGWYDIVHPEDLPSVAETWAKTLKEGHPGQVEYRLRRHDGVYCWHLARALPVRDASGAIIRWVGTNTDIQDQKDAAQKLQHLNATLEQEVERRTRERDRIWHNSNDLMGIFGFDGHRKAINPAWSQALGYDEETLLTRPFTDITHPDDLGKLQQAIQDLASGERLVLFEDRLRHADGSYRHISWTGVPGEGVFYVIGRDITGQRRMEEQLRQAQKMEAVGQLTGGLAHDFNNLLMGVTGSLELVQTRMTQGRYKDVGRYIVAAQGAATRAAALTHRLLAFSRRQTLDPKPVNMNRLIAGMEELIRRTVGPAIAIEVVGAAGLWATLVDPNQLENALLNLCINARDAMPDGGKLTIETANRWLDDRAAQERDMAPGQYLSLSVSDNGTGMSPEVIKRAFDPFFTTKPIGQGTGLGLSMIYGFAQQSGGQVQIYSELGQGTTVCLYLPRHQGEEEIVDETPGKAELPRAEQGETVLIVDDEPTVRMLVTEVLEELGYIAIEAADGVGGLKVLQSDARIDLLITDIGLPNGMNGRQLADAGRAIRKGLKVLFITGYAENAAIGNGHLEPGMQVMTKPFSIDALADRIKAIIM